MVDAEINTVVQMKDLEIFPGLRAETAKTLAALDKVVID